MRNFLIKLLGGYKIVVVEHDVLRKCIVKSTTLTSNPFIETIYKGNGFFIVTKNGEVKVEWKAK